MRFMHSFQVSDKILLLPPAIIAKNNLYLLLKLNSPSVGTLQRILEVSVFSMDSGGQQKPI